jgi:hypothetical protein
MAAASTSVTTGVAGATRADRRGRFFVLLAVMMLALLALGFGRTLYLRSLFGALDAASGAPIMPWHLYLHGGVMTGWFVVLFAQTVLVAAHRTDLHRVLGWFGTALAVLVVVVGLWTVIEGVPRNLAAGMTLEERQINVFGNIASLLPFAVCVATAVAWRRRPDVHKRFMAVASIAVTGQATQRIGLLLGVPQLALPGFLVFIFALLGYDLWARRRFHWATLVATAVLVISIVGFMMLTGTSIGSAVMDALA